VDAVAGAEAGTVVAQNGVLIGEHRLTHKRFRPLGAETPVDQYDGLSGSLQLVIELKTVE
jgi:hypothetical protein